MTNYSRAVLSMWQLKTQFARLHQLRLNLHHRLFCLMAQVQAIKASDEVRTIKANVRFADLDVAVKTFDKAIEKLSNL